MSIKASIEVDMINMIDVVDHNINVSIVAHKINILYDYYVLKYSKQPSTNMRCIFQSMFETIENHRPLKRFLENHQIRFELKKAEIYKTYEFCFLGYGGVFENYYDFICDINIVIAESDAGILFYNIADLKRAAKIQAKISKGLL